MKLLALGRVVPRSAAASRRRLGRAPLIESTARGWRGGTSFRFSFHQPILGTSGVYWLDDPPDVGCKDSTRQHAVDDPRLSCKQQVGGSSPPPAPQKPQVRGDVDRSPPDRFIARRWASPRRPTRGGIMEGGRFNRPVAVLGVLVGHQARQRPSVPTLTAGGPTSPMLCLLLRGGGWFGLWGRCRARWAGG
jgi:hypothetical protein